MSGKCNMGNQCECGFCNDVRKIKKDRDIDNFSSA